LRRLPKLRLWFLGIVNALILLHIILYYAFNRTSVGCIDFFGLATFAGKGLITSGSVFLGLLVLLTLAFGRIFCGWGCHFAFFQDALSGVLAHFGFRVPFRRSRLELIVPPILFAVTLVYPIVAWWRSYHLPRTISTDLSFPDLWHLLPGTKGVLLILFVDVVVLTVLFGSRAFCRYVCPYGLFLKFFHALSPTRVIKTGDCAGCNGCSSSCPTGVPIKYEISTFGVIGDLNCMNCGDCVANCPQGVLTIRPTKRAYHRAFISTLRLTPQRLWVDFVLLAFAVVGLFVFRGREYGDFLSAGMGLTVGAVVVSAIRPQTFARTGYLAGRRTTHRMLMTVLAGYFVIGLFGQALAVHFVRAADASLTRGDCAAVERSLRAGRRVADATRFANFYLDNFEEQAAERVPVLKRAADDAMRRSQWHAAELLCRATLAADESQIGVHGNLGTALFRQERYWEAAGSYLVVLRYDPNDLVALYHLAMTRIELGQKEAAVDIVGKILSIDKVGNASRLVVNNPLFGLLNDDVRYRRMMSLYQTRGGRSAEPGGKP
jgi:polyferredoxin